MKNVVFWDVTQCEFKINRRFGGTCRLHIQDRRNNASEESVRRIVTGCLSVCPMGRRLGEPQSRSGRYGDVKILAPIGTCTPTPPPPSRLYSP
jgi:hypothetical protein